MTTADGLLRDIIEHPEDDQLRLICADWWESVGETERADLVRVQIELANLTPPVILYDLNIPTAKEVRDTWLESELSPASLFLEASVNPAALPLPEPASPGALTPSTVFEGVTWVHGTRYFFPKLVLERVTHRRHASTVRARLLALPTLQADNYVFFYPLTSPTHHEALQAREKSLLRDDTIWDWFGVQYGNKDCGGTLKDGCIIPTFRRGFPESVVTEWENWQVHGPTLVKRHPLQEASLKHKKPVHLTNRDTQEERFYWYRNIPQHDDVMPVFLNACLPWQVYDLATESRRSYPERYFTTEKDALQAVSDALLLFARSPECHACKGSGKWAPDAEGLRWDCENCQGYGRLIPC